MKSSTAQRQKRLAFQVSHSATSFHTFPYLQVSQLRGRIDYLQQLASEAQKEAEEWRNKSEALEARLQRHQVRGYAMHSVCKGYDCCPASPLL